MAWKGEGGEVAPGRERGWVQGLAGKLDSVWHSGFVFAA